LRRLIAIAVVLLAAAGPAGAVVTEYTNEADYLNALSGLGSFRESFDDDAVWGAVRSPNRAPSILDSGITWTANNSNSEVSTSLGSGRTGWGFFSSPHGDYASGTGCEVAGACGDGFIGTSTRMLFGVGGWISGTAGGVVNFVLDGDDLNPIGFDGALPFSGSSNHLFFGVIDTDGFTQFEVREMEGTAADAEWIWADDFTMAIRGHLVPRVPSFGGPGLVSLAGALLMSALPVLMGRRTASRCSRRIRSVSGP
jgi:hypothetical protein